MHLVFAIVNCVHQLAQILTAVGYPTLIIFLNVNAVVGCIGMRHFCVLMCVKVSIQMEKMQHSFRDFISKNRTLSKKY